MNTTIALKQETMEMLKQVKVELEIETFDELVKKLVLYLKKPRQSMFGVMGEIKAKFEREEIDRFDR